MIITKELPDGRVEVSSDRGMVNIGEGPVKKIICTKDEVEMITEERR